MCEIEVKEIKNISFREERGGWNGLQRYLIDFEYKGVCMTLAIAKTDEWHTILLYHGDEMRRYNKVMKCPICKQDVHFSLCLGGDKKIVKDLFAYIKTKRQVRLHLLLN